MQYVATLFRGWEVVHIQYELEDSAVVMRRKRTWKGLETQRVELASLSGEVRRVWARQPAFMYSTVVLVAAMLVLGIDSTMHGVGAQALGLGGTGISWLLWGPLLGIGGVGVHDPTQDEEARGVVVFCGHVERRGAVRAARSAECGQPGEVRGRDPEASAGKVSRSSRFSAIPFNEGLADVAGNPCFPGDWRGLAPCGKRACCTCVHEVVKLRDYSRKWRYFSSAAWTKSPVFVERYCALACFACHCVWQAKHAKA